jgi:hypothetical protein
MKSRVLLLAGVALAGLWLVSWVAGFGVLVYSESTGWKIGRNCHYLVGVTVVRKINPVAERCDLFNTRV